MRKFSRLLGLLLSMSILISALCGVNVSAATSFNRTETNFKPVFDFDTTPGTYTLGDTAVGTRKDTVGDSKSEKCIDAQGIGLSYNLEIVNNKCVLGNALKLSVTELAPQDGAYCPISFNVRYGPKKLVNVQGATDFMFWCDTTEFKDGYTNEKGIILYLQEANVLADGSVTSESATAWKPKKGSEGGHYFYEDGNGGWIKQATNDTDFYLPVNYSGWIKMPLSAFTYCDWNGDTVNDRFYGKQIQVVQFGMGNYARQSGAAVYFDEIGFSGTFTNEPGASDSSVPNQSNQTSVDKTTGNTNSTPTNSETNTSSKNTSSSDVSADETSSEQITDESTDIDNKTDLEETESENKTENKKGSKRFLWILIPVIVLVLAGGGVAAYYFLVLKKKKVDE